MKQVKYCFLSVIRMCYTFSALVHLCLSCTDGKENYFHVSFSCPAPPPPLCLHLLPHSPPLPSLTPSYLMSHPRPHFPPSRSLVPYPPPPHFPPPIPPSSPPTSLRSDVSPCSFACLTFSNLTFKHKSKLLIETHLELQCSTINQGEVSIRLCQSLVIF